MVGDPNCRDAEGAEHVRRALVGGCHSRDEHHDEGSADYVPDSAQNAEEAHEPHCTSQGSFIQTGMPSIGVG